MDCFLSSLADNILNANKYIYPSILLALMSQAMHSPLTCFRLLKYGTQNPRHSTYATGATVSGLKTAVGIRVGSLCYSTEGDWLLRHSGARIQKVSELASMMFPSRNWDCVHRKEAIVQPYALISCCRLLSGRTPSYFSFIQVFFSLNAIFPVIMSWL